MRSLSLFLVVVAVLVLGSGSAFACTMSASMTAALSLNVCGDAAQPNPPPAVVPKRMPERLTDPDTVAACRPGLLNRVFHPFGGRFAPRFARGGGCGCG